MGRSSDGSVLSRSRDTGPGSGSAPSQVVVAAHPCLDEFSQPLTVRSGEAVVACQFRALPILRNSLIDLNTVQPYILATFDTVDGIRLTLRHDSITLEGLSLALSYLPAL